MTKTKRLLSLALALILSVTLIEPVSAAETASAIELTKTTGTVTVSKSNGKALTLRDGMRLYNGYNVTTGADSYAWISLDSAKLMKLDASGSVEVRKNGSKLEVNVKSGTVSFDVSEKLSSGESLNISTSTMSVGIRGTCGWARVTDQWESEICLLEGTSICVVADPVSGQMKSAVLHGGDVARCVVYPKERPGDKCDILMQRQSTGGIPGFLLVELVRNIPLCDRILDDSGIDVLADLAKEAGGDPSGRTPDGKSASPEVLGQAERVQGREEAETAQKLEEIQKEADSQESSISKDPVWEQGQQPSSGGGSGGGSAPTTYTVTFVYDSKTQTTQTTDTAHKLDALPEATYYAGSADFPFLGWFTAETDGAQVTADNVFSSNQTLYAQWDANWIFNKETGHLTIFNDMGMNSRSLNWGSYQNYIKTVDIRPGVSSIASSAFKDCDYLTEVTIPESVTGIGSWAFQNCASLTGVTIPESVTSIGNLTFSGCSSLTGVVIPEGVETLGPGAFSNCTRLRSVTVPGSVTGLDTTFSGCGSLTSVTVGNGVQTIDYQAFNGCAQLTAITVPESVSQIGSSAFQGCINLTRIDISATTTYIGSGAFHNCGKLTDIYFGGTRAEWNAANPGNRATVPDDCTIHCKDGDLPITVTFDAAGGTLSDGQTTTAVKTTGKLADLPAADWSGHEFFGWYTAETGGTKVSADTVFTEDTTLYARWSYTVAFNANGGTAASESAVTLADGTLAALPAASWSGHEFFGWYTAKTGGTEVAADTVFTQDTTLYARWSYTVSFDVNGSAAAAPPSMTTGADGMLSSLPTLTWEGAPGDIGTLTFEDWGRSSGGVSTRTVFTEDTTLYARWKGTVYNSGTGVLTYGSGNSADVTYFGNNQGMATTIRILEGVKNIKSDDLRNCTKMEVLELPASLSYINEYAMQNCTRLKSISVAEDNKYFSSYDGVLYSKDAGVKRLYRYPAAREGTSYTVRSDVTVIHHFAFQNSVNLQSVVIPEGVTDINNGAFHSCAALKSVVIPKSVKTIYNYGFFGCTALTDVYYGGTEEEWNAISVGMENGPLGTATVHYNSTGP